MKTIHQHSWNVSIEEAKKIQEELAPFVITEDNFKKVEKISGVGIVFSKNEDNVSVACVVLSFPQLKVLDQIVEKRNYDFPYTPSLFAFSVGPAILSVLDKIEKPDLVIFPGRGIDHPRKLGLASHLGVLLDIPTIACSKRPLWKNHPDPSKEKGAHVFVEGETGDLVRAVVRTRDVIKPLFIASGHKTSIQTAVKIVLQCSLRYRIPEPLRFAQSLAKQWKKLDDQAYGWNG
jgi:deoxyribonuclease V